MWHDIFITAHAVTGGIALLAGCGAIARRTWFGTYLVALAGMELFLVAAIGAEFGAIGTGARILFIAFAALGAVMLLKAELARRRRPGPSSPPPAAYVQHVGFTLVALFDAFIVILVLNAGAPVWLVVTSGVAVAIAGHFGIRTATARLTADAPAAAAL